MFIEVVPNPDKSDGQKKWLVRRTGDGEPVVLASSDTKEPAIRAGRKFKDSYRCELQIKNLDGTIADADSGGNDPEEIKG